MAHKNLWGEIADYFDSLVKNDEMIKEEDLIKFRDKNKKKIDYRIKKGKFTDKEFNYVSELVNFLGMQFNYRENGEIVPVYQEILKAYITLALKFNSRIDTYINRLDHSTAYFKRIKALQMVRFYKGPIEEYIYIFGDISYLIGESIIQEPKKAKEGYNIIKEYLITLDSYGLISGHTQFIKIWRYSYQKHRISILSNRSFNKWFNDFEKEVYDYHHIDEESLKKAIDKKIENMKEKGYKIPDKEIIYKNLEPTLKEYKKIKEEYEEQNKVTDNITEDMLGDIIIKYNSDYSIEECKNHIRFYIEDKKELLNLPIDRIIIEFSDDIEKKDQKGIINNLAKEFQYPIINNENVKFSGQREYIKLGNLLSCVEYHYCEVMKNLVKICSNSN